jgi:hypothetical protein
MQNEPISSLKGKGQGRVGSCGLTRERAGIWKHIITGEEAGVQRASPASSAVSYTGEAKGRGSSTASEHDYRKADKWCQE